ncbi:MAG: HAMP domain-containing histidine kinase, partial [Lachnospiraceae bacterium]|nr:HAMP domain-containing histidine kinase [Lachnospiraceae bacterium]
LQHSKEQRVSFLQNVSHDMRAHLMSVTSYAQALEAGIADPPEAGRRIIKEGDALKDIIDNDLTFSKLEDPLLPVTLSPVPVLELLQNSIDRFTAMGTRKGIIIRFESSRPELAADGNEALVEKILDNLLSNAIRYANHEIVISAESRANKVILSVADDGIGLSETDLAHVFDRYYKGRGGQHGIGLTIAHTAAERMGGSLTAENRPQGGALFTLTLSAAGSIM